MRSKVNYEIDEAPLIASTVGREFMYAVAHAIHHYALIAVMCELMKMPRPRGIRRCALHPQISRRPTKGRVISIYDCTRSPRFNRNHPAELRL